MLPDIVLLLCDTARADAFSPWGARYPTPTVARLSREGTTYRTAQSAAPWTLPSIASIFSGRLPTEHGITDEAARRPDGTAGSPKAAVAALPGPWLSERLRERGYRTWGASCNPWISTWGGFDRGFDTFLDLSDDARLPKGRSGRIVRRAARLAGVLDRGGRRVASEFERRLGRAGREPLFAFANLMEVHSPYDPPRPYYPYPFWRRRATYRMSGGTKGFRPFLMYTLGVERPSTEYVRTMRTLYRQSARYEDSLLGRFVRAIESRGRPTVVVVVSDHGENLGDHGMFGHNSALTQTLLHVPLVAWGHRVDVGAGAVEDGVSLTDLGAWIERVADGDATPIAGGGTQVSEYESTVGWIPREIHERIAATGEEGSGVPPLALHHGVAAVRGGLKYVAIDTGAESLFDLTSDPHEQRDVAATRPSDLEAFRGVRSAWDERRATRPRHTSADGADEEMAEHLRELGYIE